MTTQEKEIIRDTFENIGDSEGLNKLKTMLLINTSKELETIDKLLEDSWKLCNGMIDEDTYNKKKENLLLKYGII